jgi:hypothetical protein
VASAVADEIKHLLLNARGDQAPSESLGALAPSGPESGSKLSVREQSKQSVRNSSRIRGVDKQTRLAVFDCVKRTPDVTGEDWDAVRTGFEVDDAEALS